MLIQIRYNVGFIYDLSPSALDVYFAMHECIHDFKFLMYIVYMYTILIVFFTTKSSFIFFPNFHNLLFF